MVRTSVSQNTSVNSTQASKWKSYGATPTPNISAGWDVDGHDGQADGGGAGGDGGDGGGASKVICTALNEIYGFGSFRNAIWMKYNEMPKSSVVYPRSKILELGYQKVFGPLTEKMPNSRILTKVLRRIARVRTDRVRREMLGKPLTLESKIHLAIFRLPVLGVGLSLIHI